MSTVWQTSFGVLELSDILLLCPTKCCVPSIFSCAFDLFVCQSQVLNHWPGVNRILPLSCRLGRILQLMQSISGQNDRAGYLVPLSLMADHLDICVRVHRSFKMLWQLSQP